MRPWALQRAAVGDDYSQSASFCCASADEDNDTLNPMPRLDCPSVIAETRYRGSKEVGPGEFQALELGVQDVRLGGLGL